jgi:hypothetical protein
VGERLGQGQLAPKDLCVRGNTGGVDQRTRGERIPFDWSDSATERDSPITWAGKVVGFPVIIEDHVNPYFVNSMVVTARGEKDRVFAGIVFVDERTGLSALATATVTRGILDGIAGPMVSGCSRRAIGEQNHPQ